MSLKNVYTTDGIDIRCKVTFAPDAGASTLTGGTVVGWARNLQTGVTYAANTATATSATRARARWNPGSLPAGKYLIQVAVTPLGYDIQTVFADEIQVLAAAGP